MWSTIALQYALTVAWTIIRVQLVAGGTTQDQKLRFLRLQNVLSCANHSYTMSNGAVMEPSYLKVNYTAFEFTISK